MFADAFPPDHDDARPVADGAGQESASGETLPTAEVLSRRSTDFGLGADEAPAAGPDPLEGRDLGEVVLGQLIAQGGMGRVYEARQRSPARPVAVKLMRPSRRSPAALQRFRREAELLGRLRHPGIAQVFTAGSCRVDGEDTPYFVMEFVAEADTLVRACDRRGLAPRARLETFLDVCRAVAHGHAAGIVHRDLKPGNILVAGDGRPKVIDFGIARLEEDVAESVTETGAFLGTWQYSSPEQCEGGPVDARTDVYALGVILHELLSGRVPYEVEGSSLGEAARVIRETPPPPLVIADRELGPGIAAITLTCLAKRPADRYPSATELAEDVAKLLAGLPISVRMPGLIEWGRQWCRRHKTLTASGLTAIASAGLVAVALALSRPRGGPPRPGPGPSASIPNVSSLRTTPLQWLSVTLDEPIRSLSPADFRLTRDGTDVPLDGVTVTGDRTHWEIRGLEGMTAAKGRYVLELAGTAATPVDFAGRRLRAPARATWRMPPYEELAFNLLDDEWRRHVVSMKGVEFATERNAGVASFIRPTAPDREGSIVLKFVAPFEIQAATLTASIAVWTTGDPFPYDPRAKAALDVSPDGKTWTTLETREANRGGFGGGPFDIREFVARSREVWVRARLAASRSWPEDGLIYAQFLRTDPQRPDDTPFRLTLTGSDPAAKPPPGDAPPADG